MMIPIISLIAVLCLIVTKEGSSGPLNIQSSSLNDNGRQVKKSIVNAESGEIQPVARPVTPPTLVAPLQQAKVLINNTFSLSILLPLRNQLSNQKLNRYSLPTWNQVKSHPLLGSLPLRSHHPIRSVPQEQLIQDWRFANTLVIVI